MTIETSVSQAVEELAYQYLPYLEEEAICQGHQSLRGDYHGRSFYCPDRCTDAEKLTLAGFKNHVLNNVNAIREDGIQQAADAHALGYYMDLQEGFDEISEHWETITQEAQALFKEGQPS